MLVHERADAVAQLDHARAQIEVHIEPPSRRSARNPTGTRRARRTSSRSRSAGSASTGRRRWRAGSSRRRAARRRARRSAARSRRRPATRSTTSGATDQSKAAPSVPVGTISSRRRGTTSRPGAIVAAAREREPDVEGADVAEEGAVLMPARAGVRIDPAHRALLDRDRRDLAEVAVDDVVEAVAVERLEHVEHQLRRVGRPDAAVADPLALGFDHRRRLELELLVVAGLALRRPASARRAMRRRARSRRRTQAPRRDRRRREPAGSRRAEARRARARASAPWRRAQAPRRFAREARRKSGSGNWAWPRPVPASRAPAW